MYSYSGSVGIIHHEHFRGTHNLVVESPIIRIDWMPIVWGEALLYAHSPSAVRLAYFIDHIANTQHIDTTLTYPHQGTTRVIVYKNVVYFPLWKNEMKVSKDVDRN